ncbi:MAG: hypothetical protein RIB60_08250 [Phycisphaerales bacterium]
MAITWKQFARRAACAAALGAGTLAGHAMQPATATPEKADAQSVVDPKADAVLARSVETMWGELAETRDIESAHMKGKILIASAGIEGTVQMWIDVDDEVMKSVFTIPGLDTQQQGVFEDTAWSDSLMAGPRLMEGDEAAQLMRETDFFSDIDYEKTYSTREHLGTEEIDGEACDKIRLVFAEDGSEVMNWYSPKGLLVQQTQTVVNQMGEISIKTVFEDYRQVGLAMMPFRTVIEAIGPAMVLQFDEITVNEPLEEDDLKPTPGVLKLMG